jgi:hypothetical protein
VAGTVKSKALFSLIECLLSRLVQSLIHDYLSSGSYKTQVYPNKGQNNLVTLGRFYAYS